MEPSISTLLVEGEAGESPPPSHTKNAIDAAPEDLSGLGSIGGHEARRTTLPPSSSLSVPSASAPSHDTALHDSLYRVRPPGSQGTEDVERPSKVPRLSQIRGDDSGRTAGAPITKVLNVADGLKPSLPSFTATSRPSVVVPPAGLASGTGTAPPFSGRLSDILIDPLRDHGAGRSTGAQHVLSFSTPAFPASGIGNVDISGNTVNNDKQRTLPQLPPRMPKNPPRRPRIPPLLQGLHEVPTLPEGRMFPPITGEAQGFGTLSNLEKRVGVQRVDSVQKAKETGTAPAEGASTSASDARSQERGGMTEKRPPQRSKAASPVRPAVRLTDDEDQPAKAKRQKWSDEETKHLLQGVKRFGIGSWKTILNHPDYQFHGRRATDLKDRFRTVCPDGRSGAKKTREQSTENTAGDATDGQSSGHECVARQTVDGEPRRRKARSKRHQLGPDELAAMGIEGPFVKIDRRDRHPFTERDDVNLLRGFEKYHTEWARMRDDVELELGSRQSRDLRDRFRIRYPEKYKDAGLSLNSKDAKGADRFGATEMGSDRIAGQALNSVSPQTNATVAESAPIFISPAEHTDLRPHLLYHSRPESDFLDGINGLDDVFTEDDGGSRSPVTLSRTILQYKDTASMLASKTSDDRGPVSTKSPMAASTHTQVPPTTNLGTGLDAPSSARASSNYDNNNNLPTLVFPQVPVSSARNATHKLPRPADLLSSAGQEPSSQQMVSSNLDVSRLAPSARDRMHRPVVGPGPQNATAAASVVAGGLDPGQSAVTTSAYSYPTVHQPYPPQYHGGGPQYVVLAPPGASMGSGTGMGPVNVPGLDMNTYMPWTGTLAPLQNAHFPGHGVPLSESSLAPASIHSSPPHPGPTHGADGSTGSENNGNGT